MLCLCFIGESDMFVFIIECVGVWACCESCMYRVCKVSVLSFKWSGVSKVEL